MAVFEILGFLDGGEDLFSAARLPLVLEGDSCEDRVDTILW